MSESLMRQIDEDIAKIPEAVSAGERGRDRVMKLFAHAFLRLWTRVALESGQRLSMAPSQFVLGMYEGQMRWALNESVDYRSLAQLSISGVSRRRHSLIAETYVQKGEERARIFFALEEEKVKNKPVYVNYLVYDESTKDFDIRAAVAAIKPLVPSWLETVMTADDKPLWTKCREDLECVGV